MAHFFLIILAIVLANAYGELMPFESKPADEVVWGLCASVALMTLTGLLLNSVLSRRLRAGPASWDRFVIFAHYGSALYRLSALFLYGTLVFYWRWPATAAEWAGPLRLEAVFQLILLAPFALLLTTSWITLFPFEQSLRNSEWTLGGFLRFKATSFLPMFPLLFVSLLEDLARWLPESWRAAVYDDVIAGFCAQALIVAVLVAAFPLILRLAFKTSPMPAGELRTRLEQLAAKAGVRVRNILVWHTGGGKIANAMVSGAFPFLRYIFITDELLRSFPEAEIEAVFGHELGHARHRHLAFYAILPFFLLFLMTLGLAGAEAARLTSVFAGFATTLAVLFMGLVGFVLLSRAFERQADLFGARLCGNAYAFISALYRLGEISGKSRKLPAWLHYRLEDRIRFLLNAETDPGAEARFQRKVGKIKTILIVATLATGIASLPVHLHWQAIEKQAREARK